MKSFIYLFCFVSFINTYSQNNAKKKKTKKIYKTERVQKQTFKNKNIEEEFITICGVKWQTKNLDVSTYSDGTPIPEIKDRLEFINAKTGAWCYLGNNPNNGGVYGKLYNWYAVMGIFDEASAKNPALRKKLAPNGWHVATDSEWYNLSEENYSCIGTHRGAKIKSNGTEYWKYPNYATNESGFSALPGGKRADYSLFSDVDYGEYAYFWACTDYCNYDWMANAYYVKHDSFDIISHCIDKRFGLSVRCVKD